MNSRAGFVLDLNRCTGCRACELACSIENSLGFGRSWRRVETFNPQRDPRAPHHHLSIGCNHCENAPCLAACPAQAIRRDEESGLVTLNAEQCLGCGYCAWVCPFEAPVYDEAAGVMGKCTLCPERTARGEKPVCVEACPTEALQPAGPEDSALTASVPGFPETSAEPAMRFRPLRAGTRPVEMTFSLDPEVLAAFDAVPRSRGAGGDLRHEWPLVVLTLVAAALAAFQTAVAMGSSSSRVGMALASVAAAGISIVHLGRPDRAWRAAAAFGSSWLSREIIGYGVFVALLVIQAIVPDFAGVAPTAAGMGWLVLFAVDRVYDSVRRPRSLPVHSADVLGVAALLTVVLTGQVSLALTLAGVRVLLFLVGLFGNDLPVDRPVLRIIGRVAPLAIGLTLMVLGENRWAALFLIGLGEGVDRTLFYLDLRPTTFAETAAADLGSVIR